MPTTDDPFLPVQGTQGTTPSTDFDLGLDTPPATETTDFNLNFWDTPTVPTPENQPPIDLANMSIELPSETASETAPQSEIFLDKSLETPVEETPIGETPAEENPSLIADDFSLNLWPDTFTPAPISDPTQIPAPESPIPAPESPIPSPTLEEISTPTSSSTTDSMQTLIPTIEESNDSTTEILTSNTNEPTSDTEMSFEPIVTPEIPPVDFSESSLSETPIWETTLEIVQPSLESPSTPESSLEIPPDALTSEMVTPETSPEIPSMEYQPTSDTFNQTIVALDAAKAEGTTFISSEELSAPVSTPPSTPTEVLNLDQMVAKFNGEKIPDTTPDAQEDPFAPMKKALEAEEKKTLEAKGVDINGIPLILQPEANVESPIPQPEPISEPSPAENQPSAEPEEPAKTKHPPLKLEEPQLEQTPTPTTTLSLDEIMDSGILPAPQSPPTPPPSTEISTKIDFSGLMKKLKKNAGIFAGVGGLIVAIFVLFTMFPSEKTELPAPVENLPPTTPTEDHDSAPETPSGGVSLFPDSSETSTTEDEFQPTIPDEIFPTEPSEIPADPQPLDGADEQPIFPTEISTQDMIQNLMSQYNFAQQLVEIWERQDDAYLVKYAGYVLYQSDLLIKRLENGEILSIEEYTILYDRMNTFLTQMQAYVNGEFDPNLSTTTQTSESEKQQLQEFIYSKNGTY